MFAEPRDPTCADISFIPGGSWHRLPPSQRDHDRLCSVPLKNPHREPWTGPPHRGQGRSNLKKIMGLAEDAAGN